MRTALNRQWKCFLETSKDFPGQTESENKTPRDIFIDRFINFWCTDMKDDPYSVCFFLPFLLFLSSDHSQALHNLEWKKAKEN